MSRSAASKLSAHVKDGRQLLAPMPALAVLSPRVTTVLGCNPSSFSLQGTNTYLVGSGPRKILVDSGEGRADYLGALEQAMAACGCAAIEQIVITHWHHDHLGGVPSIQERFGPGIPVRKYMPEEGPGPLTSKGEAAINPYSIWPREAFEPLHDGEVLRTEGASMRVLFTPGHANDHVSLVLEEEGSIFTADNVLGVGTAVFSDLSLYLASLARMRQESQTLGNVGGHDHNVMLYPGHGPVIENGVRALEEYIEHRMARVRQVSALLLGDGDAAECDRRLWTAEEVTRAIYAGYPEKLIAPAVSDRLFRSFQVVCVGGLFDWDLLT